MPLALFSSQYLIQFLSVMVVEFAGLEIDYRIVNDETVIGESFIILRKGLRKGQLLIERHIEFQIRELAKAYFILMDTL